MIQRINPSQLWTRFAGWLSNIRLEKVPLVLILPSLALVPPLTTLLFINWDTYANLLTVHHERLAFQCVAMVQQAGTDPESCNTHVSIQMAIKTFSPIFTIWTSLMWVILSLLGSCYPQYSDQQQGLHRGAKLHAYVSIFCLLVTFDSWTDMSLIPTLPSVPVPSPTEQEYHAF